ncbi:hypothetical protein ASE21_04700 [Flavobacterium sp. Root901]|uniref:hypothetical protein n=1 Tax=Flavobacterium sp. Root901 TaxID=1736605 RepID=UPI00070FFA91|nr:hypothetical protein [Flavobacterium sp. Root901]KRD11025.1 hypothetical protein ASE21_04700 [Flavobacterium sp. Root901]
MKKSFTIIISSLFLLSCDKKEKTFDSLEYSFGGTFSEVYSLKFTDNDTVYVYQEWIAKDFDDSISDPKSKTQYYGIMNSEEKLKLYNYIEKVNLFKYKSEYYKNYTDGSCYAISVKKDNKSKTIFAHSHETPKEIDSIAGWINKVKKNLHLKKTKKHLIYKTSDSVFPPPPPPPIKNINN